MDEIIFFFIEHWRGELSVSKAAWLSGIIAVLLVIPTNAMEIYSFLSINNVWSFADVVARMQNGNLEFSQPPLMIEAMNQLVESIVLVWWAVGSWRACANPDNNRHGQQSWWYFRSVIVGTAALQVYDLYDFISRAMGTQ